MMRTTVWAALAFAAAACASITPEGARVRVYEADLATPAEARRLPDGCRLLATTAPVDQMESERHVDDPYRVQRNATGAQGGNVLLVLSSRFVTRYKTDCAPSDTSADCQNRAQNWYKVGFESYACDAPAAAALAKLESDRAPGVSSWWPFGREKPPTAAPAAATSTAAATSASPPASAISGGMAAPELKGKLLVLVREGVGTDVLVAYAKSHPLASALSAEDILDWKKSGIPEPVIEAALAPFASPR